MYLGSREGAKQGTGFKSPAGLLEPLARPKSSRSLLWELALEGPDVLEAWFLWVVHIPLIQT